MRDKHLYRFGDFELYADENVLQRNGDYVPLTPKMYDMLCVLVRNPGQVLEKDRLLKEVWPDSFVEEGNIAFNIRQLRKALEDDAQSPVFIETVPRRGYRFIAEVEEIDPAARPDETADGKAQFGAAAQLDAPASKRFYPSLAILSLTLACATLTGVWFLLAGQRASGPPLLSTPFASEKLSTTGMVYAAAISPDGETVVYSVHHGSRQSLWLRQLSTSNNLEIVPPSNGEYYEANFSPDGASIYFSRGTDTPGGRIDIFRIPARGGIPQKIVSSTEGWLSVSADGNTISFVRCPYRDDEYCSLWVADSRDGGNERKLVSRPRPIRIADHEISPDGTRVAFSTGQSRNQANEFRLTEVGIADGIEREVSDEKFFNVKSLAWLPDQSGLLITASRIPNKYFRIWRVPTGGGSAEPLTKDSETYSVLSLDRSARRLVSTQIEQDFRAYRFEMGDPSKKLLLADATSTAFGPEGKIYFSSTMSGNDEIWSMNADGSEQRQLTNDPADDRVPVVSPDGKTIYFSSNRTGEARIWSIGTDGSNPTPVEHQNSGVPLFISTDGKALYYRRSMNSTLGRVSLETGEESQVLEHRESGYIFSSDGARVAFVQSPFDRPVLVIASLPEGTIVHQARMAGDRSRFIDASWNPDGQSLLYVVADNDDGKNKLYRHTFDGAPPYQIIDLGIDEGTDVPHLSISRDGKYFVLVQGRWKHNAVLLHGLK